MKKILFFLLSAVLVLGMVTGCSKSTETTYINDTPLVVVTMIDTEGAVLGEIIVLLLENNGFKIEDKSQTVVGPELLRTASTLRQAQITVDYTGNGAYIMDEVGDRVWNDLESGYQRIREWDLAQNNLVWLEPARANNTELLAITKEFAEDNNIQDMYDFADYVNNGGYLKLGSPQYWLSEEGGFSALEEAYGFHVTDSQIVIGSKVEKEVAAGIDGFNCTLVYTTDGILDELGLFVIPDPLEIPPIFAPTPIVAGEILEAYPQIATIINPVFSGITTVDLSQMNGTVLSKGISPRTVANDYLKVNGYLQ